MPIINDCIAAATAAKYRMSRSIMPIPTVAGLRAAALHYLARYAAGSENLRRVLLRRIARAAAQHPELDAPRQAQLRAEAEQIIASCIAKNIIDDDAYAVAQARRARAQGKSARLVTAKLRQKGLTQPQITAALATADTSESVGVDPDQNSAGDAEYRAALRLARRRKLGPYRIAPGDAAQARRDLAALARAGFSGAVARHVLQCSEDDSD